MIKLIKIFIVAILLLAVSELNSQTIVNSISFEGNNYFSDNDLLSATGLKKDKNYSAGQLDLDLKSIREKYRSSGFLLAKITNVKKVFDSDSLIVDLTIYLNEGKRVTVGKINITGNKIISEREIKELFETKTNKPLDDNVLNNDIKALLDYYEKKGIPFAKAYLKDLSLYEVSGEPKISILINIEEDIQVKIDFVKIRGNEVTDEKVILRELKLKNDKLIKRESLQNIKLRLERLNIFENVSEPKIYTLKKTKQTGLLLEVKEGNTNTFDGVIGYAPPPNDKEKGYLTGLINLSFRNLFGSGRKIEAKWQKPLKSTQELEFKYGEPYFLGFPVNLGLGFLQRIQDTSYTHRKFDLKGDFIFTDRFTVSLLAGYDRVIPSDDTTRAFFVSDSRIFLTGIELRYDSRDNVFIPLKGIIYKAFYSYGDKRIFNPAKLVSTVDQSYSMQKYSSEVEVYSSFFKRQSLLMKFFAGESRSAKLEDADFFRVGGNKNIRGYREEQFLASRLAYSNVELRYSLSRKSFAYTFFDFGYFTRPEDTKNLLPKQEEFLYGFGLGIRLETGLGLVGVNYALGKGDGFLDGKIHFGIINDF